MDNQNLQTLIDTMLLALSEQSFKEADGIYKNSQKAFKVEYDEAKQLFLLFTADVLEDGAVADFEQKSAWLFTADHNKKDAQFAGEDFADTVLEILGKKPTPQRKTQVDLPEKTRAGQTVNVSGLCSSLLSVYPQFKDAYKEHVEHYGEFLCIKFFRETVCIELNAQLKEDNKKKLKKVIDTLCENYVNGDRTVCNIITEAIILRAVGEDEQLLNTALKYMDDCPYLSTALRALARRLKNDKKLRKVVLE